MLLCTNLLFHLPPQLAEGHTKQLLLLGFTLQCVSRKEQGWVPNRASMLDKANVDQNGHANKL